MIRTLQVSLPRCLAVGAVATFGGAALIAWLLPTVVDAGDGSFAATLVRICAALAVGAAAWLWFVTVLTVVDALRGREHDVTGVAGSVRHVVLAACGLALASGLATGTAQATPGRLHEDRTAASTSVLAGLPLPDRATARPAPAPTVRVRPGDSLWSIAADRLGAGASDAEIDACWRRLYDLNRTLIGPDPDLIHPAQRLEVLP